MFMSGSQGVMTLSAIHITNKGCGALVFAVFVWLFFLSDAGGEQNSEYDYTQKLDTYARYVPSRSAQEQSGKVGIIESEFEYAYQLKAFDKLPVKFSIGSQYIGINNSTAVKLPAHLTAATAGIETTLP